MTATKASVSLALLLGIGCAFAQDVKVTQCFREKTLPPCEQWKVEQEYCRTLKEKLFRDESRSCYGQRWSIPKGFYQTKYVAYQPITETLILVIGRPGLVDGIAGIVPGRGLSKVPTLYKEVKVYALPIWTFEQRKQQTIRSSQSTGGLADMNRQVHGLRVFDQTRTQAGQHRDVFLFPPENAPWYAQCIVKPGVSFEEGLKSQGGCFVVHGIDDRVYLKYWVQKSELADVERINAEVTKLVRGFMVSQ